MKHFLFLLTLIVSLSACNQHLVVNHIDGVNKDISKIDNLPKEYQDLIAPYAEKLDAEMNQVLNESDLKMERNIPEGLLGNFVADLTYKTVKNRADLCVLNNGGLRTTLPKGAITKGKLFELLPFENEVVIVTISGEKTEEMLQYIAKKGGVPVANLTLQINNDTVASAIINGNKFDRLKTYRVVTSDYLAHGGDKMIFFNNPIKYEEIDLKLRDAIINYVIQEKQNGNTINAALDGRIKHVE